MTRIALALAVALVVAGCGHRTPPVGWDGPVPSPEAQGWIGATRGRALPAGDPLAGWEVVGFLVAGDGPRVVVRRDGKSRSIPVPDDAAAAAFHERVTGTPPAQSRR